jgi:hypothetical protein
MFVVGIGINTKQHTFLTSAPDAVPRRQLSFPASTKMADIAVVQVEVANTTGRVRGGKRTLAYSRSQYCAYLVHGMGNHGVGG